MASVAISSSRGIFPTQGSNLGLLHCSWILYHLSHQGSPLKSDLKLERQSILQTLRAARKCGNEVEGSTFSFHRQTLGLVRSACRQQHWVLMPQVSETPLRNLRLRFLVRYGVSTRIHPMKHPRTAKNWCPWGLSLVYSSSWGPSKFNSACWWQNRTSDLILFSPSAGLFPWYHPGWT